MFETVLENQRFGQAYQDYELAKFRYLVGIGAIELRDPISSDAATTRFTPSSEQANSVVPEASPSAQAITGFAVYRPR